MTANPDADNTGTGIPWLVQERTASSADEATSALGWASRHSDRKDDPMVVALTPRRRVSPPVRGLPVARLPSPARDSSLYYVVTTVDSRGRAADRSPIRALGWAPGQPLVLSVTPGALVIAARPAGPERITGQGHLRVPAPVRRVYRLEPGDRLLLAACPERDLLLAYPMATVDAMLRAYHAPVPDQAVP